MNLEKLQGKYRMIEKSVYQTLFVEMNNQLIKFIM